MVAVLQAIDCCFLPCVVANSTMLPARVRDEIRSTRKIQSFGTQELTGDDDSGNLMWSAEGYWSDNKFVVTGYGSHSCHWDGQTVQSTVNAY